METETFSTGTSSVKKARLCSWQSVQASWKESWSRLEARIQEDPREYFLAAIGVGYLLQFIPWRTLFLFLAELCLRLLRPVLILAAAIKLAQFAEKMGSSEF